MRDFAFVSISSRVKRSLLVLLISLIPAACLDGGGSDGGGNSSTTPGSSGGAGLAPPPADLTNVGIAGKTYYVATNGNDGSSGLSLNEPFRTITKAVSVVNPGDTIEVRGGTYAGGVWITRSGRADAWIKIKPHNGEHVVIDGSGKDIALYLLDNTWRLDRQNPMYWIIEGLEIKGGGSYVVKIDAPFVRLVGNNLHGSGADIVKLVRTADDITIYGNEVHHNVASQGANAQGIDITGPNNIWVAHNYVHDTVSIAIYSKGNSRNSVFENNRVENIADRGIMLGQNTGVDFMEDGVYETYDGIARNNVIVNTLDACLATASSWNVKIYNNSCYNAARGRHGAIFVSNESEIGQAGTHVEIKNNIIVVSSDSARPVVKIGPDAMTDMGTLHVDNNIYWTTSGTGEITFIWDDARSPFWSTNLDTWRRTTGNDSNSKVVDPKYAGTMLTLSADSPAIDTGIATDAVTYDYLDKARPVGASIDIGAYEFSAS